MKCDLWSKFDCLISHLNSYKSDISDKLKYPSILITECLETDPNPSLSMKLSFICEQINLLTMKVPKYSSETLMFSCKFFFTYPAAYRLIRNISILILPHPVYLKKMVMDLGHYQSGISNSHITYLHKKSKILNKEECIVNVLLDEIYVKPKLLYKSGRIEGMSKNIENTKATTMQLFMISSVFSKNKDVVALFPVKNLTGIKLHEMTCSVLKLLKKFGYKVITIISDNNRINRVMFEKFCNGLLTTNIQNPYSPSDKIFLLFDSVHLLKCIRNNWLNQHDNRQTFVFPTLQNSVLFDYNNSLPDICFDNLQCLKTIHFQEKSSTVKLAPKLSKKVLYPSKLERQNVALVCSIFDEKNIAALRIKHQIQNSKETSYFLDIISKWWKIVNVKHPHKGKILKDKFSEPITDTSDFKVIFLRNMFKWLQVWNNYNHQVAQMSSNRHGKLTVETQKALENTIKAMYELTEFILNELGAHYVLLGKFQTDMLEAHFGQYRQMSGSNYHISVSEVIESERKLKLISLLSMISSNIGNFQIKAFLESCANSAELDRFDFDVEEAFEGITEKSDDIIVTEQNMSVLIYTAGYVAYSVIKKTSCEQCKSLLACDSPLEYECTDDDLAKYLKLIDRGGPKWPQEFVVVICINTFQIFQTILNDYECEFLALKNGKKKL
ncbi:uncharacterized protein LOC111626460 [Centruroides sculpturatus]|uniref:uncharacterized protein LOC111626460 n=1 Tax=Centruroides sculpturatus TaxID=218467 RepID=UPI000C6E29A9|nr:uncharacterized protein LOC111626460 [Centruroides sculpturatus]